MTFWTNTSEAFTFPNRLSDAVRAVVRRSSKITGRSYTSRAVVASLSYIGQESDGVGKETHVLDEKGNEVKPADFGKAVKEWCFNPEIDKRNESKTKGQRKTRLTT